MGAMPTDTVLLADRPVHRIGFGAMQLPGPGVFGPPEDRRALAVVRRAVEAASTTSTPRSSTGPTWPTS